MVTQLPTRVHFQFPVDTAGVPVTLATAVNVGVYVPLAMYWLVVPDGSDALLCSADPDRRPAVSIDKDTFKVALFPAVPNGAILNIMVPAPNETWDAKSDALYFQFAPS
jgi:hypothetical protein